MKENTKKLMSTIGKNIKYYRELSGLSMDELAQKTGYKNRSSIAKIEAGETRIQAYKMIDFAAVFGVEVSELTRDSSEEPIEKLIIETITAQKETPKEPTENTFKNAVNLLIGLNEDDLEKAYKLLTTMFGE